MSSDVSGWTTVMGFGVMRSCHGDVSLAQVGSPSKVALTWPRHSSSESRAAATAVVLAKRSDWTSSLLRPQNERDESMIRTQQQNNEWRENGWVGIDRRLTVMRRPLFKVRRIPFNRRFKWTAHHRQPTIQAGSGGRHAESVNWIQSCSLTVQYLAGPMAADKRNLCWDVELIIRLPKSTRSSTSMPVMEGGVTLTSMGPVVVDRVLVEKQPYSLQTEPSGT